MFAKKGLRTTVTFYLRFLRVKLVIKWSSMADVILGRPANGLRATLSVS